MFYFHIFFFFFFAKTNLPMFPPTIVTAFFVIKERNSLSNCPLLLENNIIKRVHNLVYWDWSKWEPKSAEEKVFYMLATTYQPSSL